MAVVIRKIMPEITVFIFILEIKFLTFIRYKQTDKTPKQTFH